MGRRLFTVAEVFRLRGRPGLVLAADCPQWAAPPLAIGQRLEFRNPSGSVTRAVVSGVEFLEPPDSSRPFAFPVRPDPPESPVEIGADVWSVPE